MAGVVDMSVLADGCFDPIHVGHVNYLRAASRLCRDEELFVRVAPDAVVEAKGRSVFQTSAQRADCLSAMVCCRCWFYETLAEAIRDRKPRLLVKGIDWHGRLPADVIAACEEVGTAIVYVMTREKSSTERLA
jgi:cytidyltransferase-like protein